MRISTARLSPAIAALAAALAASAALAQDEPAPFTVTGGATITSDYRFRGISQTNKRFAIQGTLGVSTAAGFYIGTWGSSIDDYVAFGSDQEIDIYGGYKKTINGTTIDGGLLYYYYPGSSGLSKSLGGPSLATDFFEPYLSVSHTFGPVGVKVGGNYAWKQHGLAFAHTRDDGLYGYAELSGAIPDTGVTLTGHVGHSFEANYITFGAKYTDYSITAAYTWKNLTFSASYVDTNKNGAKSFLSAGPTRNVGKGGVVASIGAAF